MSLLNLTTNINHKNVVIFQSEEAECGLACLTVLLRSFGANANINDLRADYGSTRGGISVQNLIKLSSDVGLRLIGQPNASLDELENRQLPCMALWRDCHFVVITNINESSVSYIDPNVGQINTSLDAAKELYENLLLIPRVINSTFEERWGNKKLPNSTRIPIKQYVSAIGVVSISIATVTALLASIFQISTAQIQDVFFDWVLQMRLNNWAAPLGWVQIGVGTSAALAAFSLSIIVAIRYTRISNEWNLSIFRKMLSLPESFFLDRRSGDIISKFQSVDQILSTSQSSIVNVIISGINVIVLFFVLSTTSGLLAAIALLGLTIAVYWTAKILPIQKEQEQTKQQAEIIAGKSLYDIISDVQQIRLEGREYYYLKKIAAAEVVKYKAQMKISWTSSLESMIITGIDSGVSALILLGAAYVIIKGNMSLGQYAAINVLIGIALSPLLRISPILASLQKSTIAYRRLGELQDYKGNHVHEQPQQANARQIEESQLFGFEARNLSFRYSKYSNHIIHNLNMQLEDASFPLLINSDVGAGKSTLAKIISGRLIPTAGSIFINGENIANNDNKNKIIGLVDGKPYLIQGSILSNMTLGTQAISQDVFELADELGFSSLPILSDLNRIILGSGSDLSGGELVLIQLIRNLLRKPNYLVLDEIFSPIAPRYHHYMAEGILNYCHKTLFINHLYPESLRYKTQLTLSGGEVT